MEGTERVRAVLTIAGSDSGGNAGIQADLRAFHVFGVHGCTAVTALTAQNPFGVKSVLVAEPAFVADELDQVLGVYDIAALKTGMLATAGVVGAVADALLLHARIPKVIDPVMVATSGARLLDDDAVGVLEARLLPLATLVTPNIPEAEALSGKPVRTAADQRAVAAALADRFGCAVLVKGGHGAAVEAVDVLADGAGLTEFRTPRVADPLSTHGTGCSLSAAIAASLATGRSLPEAVAEGKAYVYESIRTGVRVGEQAAVMGTPKRLPVEAVSRETVGR
jgi:hydroxymethylpyrimidine kinase/phosphomethylpyrimidine kinase